MGIVNNTRYETEPIIELARASDMPSWVNLQIREFKPTPKFVKDAESFRPSAIKFPFRSWPFVRLAFNQSMDIQSRRNTDEWVVEIASPESLKEAPLTPMEHVALLGGTGPSDIWVHVLMRLGVIRSNQWIKQGHYEKPSNETLGMIARLLREGKVPDRAIFHVTDEQKSKMQAEASRRNSWVTLHDGLKFRQQEVRNTIREVEDLRRRLTETEKLLEVRRKAEDTQVANIRSLRETLEEEGYQNIDSWRTQ